MEPRQPTDRIHVASSHNILINGTIAASSGYETVPHTKTTTTKIRPDRREALNLIKQSLQPFDNSSFNGLSDGFPNTNFVLTSEHANDGVDCRNLQEYTMLECLVSMGFDKDAALNALKSTKFRHIQHAVEMLINNGSGLVSGKGPRKLSLEMESSSRSTSPMTVIATTTTPFPERERFRCAETSQNTLNQFSSGNQNQGKVPLCTTPSDTTIYGLSASDVSEKVINSHQLDPFGRPVRDYRLFPQNHLHHNCQPNSSAATDSCYLEKLFQRISNVLTTKNSVKPDPSNLATTSAAVPPPLPARTVGLFRNPLPHQPRQQRCEATVEKQTDSKTSVPSRHQVYQLTGHQNIAVDSGSSDVALGFSLQTSPSNYRSFTGADQTQRQTDHKPLTGQSSTSSSTDGEHVSRRPDHELMRCISPLPETVVHRFLDRTTSSSSSDSPSTSRFSFKPCTPQAFKFFMEQHVENVIKQHKERQRRCLELEKEMQKANFSHQVQCHMRNLLKHKESQYLRLKRQRMDASMFSKIKTIGVGAFGEVTLVIKKDTKTLFAMKTLRKSDVIKRNQAAHVKAERDILSEADNEWVVKLYYSFQDRNNLFFIMEYIPGGDMMALLIKKGIFDEDLARFYIAELICAIESVHRLKFIHRDIKPDNILIDQNGHIKLTDFGLCTGLRWTHDWKRYAEQSTAIDHYRQDSFDLLQVREPRTDQKVLDFRYQRPRRKAHSLVGTPNYIAPEVLLRIGHTQLCDFWSVGVILYEMVIGHPPFLANSPEETQLKVVHWREMLMIPAEPRLSTECVSLILGLCRGHGDRLGRMPGVSDIKTHPFFDGLDWDSLRRMKAPYKPEIAHPTDTSNFDPVEPRSAAGSVESLNVIDENDNVEVDSQTIADGNNEHLSHTALTPSGIAPRPHRARKRSATRNHNFRPSPNDHAFYEFTFRRFFNSDGYGCPTFVGTGASGGGDGVGLIHDDAATNLISAGPKIGNNMLKPVNNAKLQDYSATHPARYPLADGINVLSVNDSDSDGKCSSSYEFNDGIALNRLSYADRVSDMPNGPSSIPHSTVLNNGRNDECLTERRRHPAGICCQMQQHQQPSVNLPQQRYGYLRMPTALDITINHPLATPPNAGRTVTPSVGTTVVVQYSDYGDST